MIMMMMMIIIIIIIIIIISNHRLVEIFYVSFCYRCVIINTLYKIDKQ
jgi:hypothetical protein